MTLSPVLTKEARPLAVPDVRTQRQYEARWLLDMQGSEFVTRQADPLR